MLTQAPVNERLKLLATALNNIGLAFVLSGAILQVISGGVTTVQQALVAGGWILLGIVAHVCGQLVLGFVR